MHKVILFCSGFGYGIVEDKVLQAGFLLFVEFQTGLQTIELRPEDDLAQILTVTNNLDIQVQEQV